MPTLRCFWRGLIPWTMLFVIETPKRHILGWIRVVWCMDRVYTCTSTRFSAGDDEKGREGILKSPIWGADPFGLICTKIGTLVGVHDVIHLVQIWFQYCKGFQIYRGSKFPFSHWLCWSSLQQCCRYREACDLTRCFKMNAWYCGVHFYYYV